MAEKSAETANGAVSAIKSDQEEQHDMDRE